MSTSPSSKADLHPTLRPIHYLGNKSRLLGAITDAIDSISPITAGALDLFAGSGVVARRLATRRPVHATDVQEYSRVLTSALLQPANIPAGPIVAEASDVARRLRTENDGLTALIALERHALDLAAKGDVELLADVVEGGSLMAARLAPQTVPTAIRDTVDTATTAVPNHLATALVRYYGGVYFSYEQALELDALASIVRALPADTRDTGLAALLSTASAMTSSVGGHFAQPIRPRASDGTPKRSALAGLAKRREVKANDMFSTWLSRYAALTATSAGTTERADYRAALADPPAHVGVVYADPPYTRDHYSRFYHVLETISLGDEPELSMVRIDGQARPARGLYRVHRHQSPFCIASTVDQAFEDLFRLTSTAGLRLVVSYSPYSASIGSRPRLRDVEDIIEQAKNWFDRVGLQSVGRHAHSKFNSQDRNFVASAEAEVLLLCS